MTRQDPDSRQAYITRKVNYILEMAAIRYENRMKRFTDHMCRDSSSVEKRIEDGHVHGYQTPTTETTNEASVLRTHLGTI